MKEDLEIEKNLSQEGKSDRIIGKLGGFQNGPTLVFIGSLHGNEPAGMKALKEIFYSLKKSEKQFRGKAIALCGNLKALQEKQRYIDTDLNRLWFDEQIEKINDGSLTFENANWEEKEQIELYGIIQNIIAKEKGPFMFFDLHTTSSPSAPFILINDTLLNRQLAEKYPLRVILGIEEYLEGPLLSYINDQGYISLGFEAGQHNDPNTLEVNKRFILQTFMLTGFMKDKKMYQELIRSRKKLPFAHNFFEVIHRYIIKEGEMFKMLEGYTNFSVIKSNQLLANNQDGEIKSLDSGYLFMPLYQTKGNEGFYIIKLIPTFWIRFSSFLRRINFDYLLLALPGVHRYEKGYKTLLVNIRIARFLSREIFHLLGYRRVKRDGFNFIYIKRESINQL